MFEAIDGLVPAHLSEIWTPHKYTGALQSSGQLFLESPRSRFKQTYALSPTQHFLNLKTYLLRTTFET